MNPLINVRLPQILQKETEKYCKADGFSNMQDLIKSLLREYAIKKKKEEDARNFLALYGSQKGKKVSKKELDSLAKELFY